MSDVKSGSPVSAIFVIELMLKSTLSSVVVPSLHSKKRPLNPTVLWTGTSENLSFTSERWRGCGSVPRGPKGGLDSFIVNNFLPEAALTIKTSST